MSGPVVVVERAPEGWTHIGGPGLHLLIALDEDDDRTLAASDAADGGDLDDVIDVLTAGGLRQAIAFVGVHSKPRTRIVALGPVAAEVTVGSGTPPVVHEVRPTSRRVWTDVELADHPERVVIKVLDGAGASDAPSAGVLPIRIGPAVTSPEAAAAHDPDPAPAPTPAPAAQTAMEPETAPPTAAPAPLEPAPVLPTFAPSPPAADTSGSREQTSGSREQTSGSREQDVESTWAGRPVQDGGAPRAAAAPDGASVPAGTDGLPSYDYLFGQTVAADAHRKVLADLGRATGPDEPDEPDDEPDPDDGTDGGAGAGVDGPTAAGGAAAPGRPAASAAPSSRLISSVPWATSTSTGTAGETASGLLPAPPTVPTFAGRRTPPPAPSLLPPALTPALAPPPSATKPAAGPRTEPTEPTELTEPTERTEPAPPDQGHLPVQPVSEEEESALTVDRSALLDARHAARTSTGSGPSVLAVLCALGHPSPPHAGGCRVCGGEIPTQEPFAMPRPSLGVLRLSSGDVVTLDRSVLLGRSPKPGDGLAASDRPHVVKVPSPERDVSRNHLEVVLEGWHVLVRDLGTTNGSTVTLPGRGPVRVRAHDQQVLEPGSVVSMADEVSFTFEVQE